MKVTNKQDRLISLPGGVSLMPGINDVDGKAWDAASQHEMVQQLMKSGVLEADTGGGQGMEDLTDMTVADAKEAISTTTDPALLSRWREADGRKGVLAAIDARMSALGTTGGVTVTGGNLPPPGGEDHDPDAV